MPAHTDFFQRLVIEGGGLEKFNSIGTERLMLSCSMSLTVEQASEISIDFNDPNWTYAQSFKDPKAKKNEDRGPIGKKAMYGTDMPLAVTSMSLGPGPVGIGGTTLKLQPGGIFRSKNIKGALTRNNITPTQYAKDAAAHAGMKFVGQNSPVRPSIVRDTAAANDASSEASDWSTVQRLAGEEGFLAYECLNTLYFATPKWLFDKMPTYTVGLGSLVADDNFRLMELPSIEMSTAKKDADEITFKLPLRAAGKILPGHTVTVKGVPGIGDTKLLVTSVDYPLVGIGDLTLKAKYPWTIEKQAQAGQNTGGGGRGGGSFGSLPGNTDGERAVNACIAKRGTPYSWGGGGYNGPTKGIRDGGVADSYGDYNKVGFDCSGLMQYGWFQGSRGRVKLPRTTYDQRNAGPRISMSQLRPGDLIMMSNDGHVGMYAGGGKMVEAPQSGDVVKVSNTRGGYGVRIN